MLLPPLIFGPPIQDVKTLKNINYSTDVFYSLINGTHEVVPPTSFAAYVSETLLSDCQQHDALSVLDWLMALQIDVQDLAAAHLATLTSPGAQNKRFIVGHPVSFRTIVDHLRGVPELEGRLPKDSNEETTYPRLDTEPARRDFNIQYRSAEDTFVGLAKQLLALEEKLGRE